MIMTINCPYYNSCGFAEKHSARGLKKSKVRGVSVAEETTTVNPDVIYEENNVYRCKIIDNESTTENCGYLIELNSSRSLQEFFNRILKFE